MKIKAIKSYYDRQIQDHVRDGMEYEVKAERGKKLIELKCAEEVKAAAPAVTEPEQEVKKK